MATPLNLGTTSQSDRHGRNWDILAVTAAGVLQDQSSK